MVTQPQTRPCGLREFSSLSHALSLSLSLSLSHAHARALWTPTRWTRSTEKQSTLTTHTLTHSHSHTHTHTVTFDDARLGDRESRYSRHHCVQVRSRSQQLQDHTISVKPHGQMKRGRLHSARRRREGKVFAFGGERHHTHLHSLFY
jgi:hypothetical protein